MKQFEKYLPELVIERPYYLAKELSFKDIGLIKLLLGQRRVGKSYMLFQLMNELFFWRKSADMI
jgi:uncharacterized protein